MQMTKRSQRENVHTQFAQSLANKPTNKGRLKHEQALKTDIKGKKESCYVYIFVIYIFNLKKREIFSDILKISSKSEKNG